MRCSPTSPKTAAPVPRTAARRPAAPHQPRKPIDEPLPCPPQCRRPGGKHALLLRAVRRSEEPTSELQSLMRTSYAVFCLKKKNNLYINRDQSEHWYTYHNYN